MIQNLKTQRITLTKIATIMGVTQSLAATEKDTLHDKSNI